MALLAWVAISMTLGLVSLMLGGTFNNMGMQPVSSVAFFVIISATLGCAIVQFQERPPADKTALSERFLGAQLTPGLAHRRSPATFCCIA